MGALVAGGEWGGGAGGGGGGGENIVKINLHRDIVRRKATEIVHRSDVLNLGQNLYNNIGSSCSKKFKNGFNTKSSIFYI